MQGIYKITIGNKFYYGQSMDLNNRRSQHLSNLKNNKHCNKFMQRVYNKYLDFNFEVVEEVVDVSLLDSREQYYIDLHIDNADCMNLARCAESTRRGCIVSEESRAKMSAAQKGKTISEETRAKISAFNKGKIISAEHRAILTASHNKQVKVTYPNGYFDIFASAKEAGLKFDLSLSCISGWCTGTKPQPGTGQVRKKIEHLSGYTFTYLEERRND